MMDDHHASASHPAALIVHAPESASAMISRLSMDQLRVLVEIADRGSFSAAARALGRVQSAISQSVQSLEATQGVAVFDRRALRPRLTPVGQALVEQARVVLASAARFEAIAAGTRAGLEPALTVAIDPLVPTAPLIRSLRALGEAFPTLPLSFSTEGVGGAERRLRSGEADLAICLLLPEVPADLVAWPVMSLELIPVVAATHPLARLRRPLTRADLEAHVQLVLADALGADGPAHGVASARVWRFADLARRLDFLLAGFGWCKMPPDVVEAPLQAGRLVRLNVQDESIAPSQRLPVYAAHARARPPGVGGGWLLGELRRGVVEAQVAA